MLSALRRDAVVWVVRALWVALPFTAGSSLSGALASTSEPVRVVAFAGLWAGWAAGMIAACVPHPAALTTLRILAPAGAAAAIDGAIHGHPSALAVAWTLLATAWVNTPAFGEWCVNGPAYPNERRVLLRSPGPLLGGMLGIAVAWDVVAAGACAGPLLLAAKQWVPGAAALVVGWPMAVVFARSLHGLSKRWVVFVPAGMVLHDPVGLRDPILFQRRAMASVSLAPLGRRAGGPAGAVDLTQRAPGQAVELRTRQPVSLTLMRFGQRLGRTVETDAVVFTPTRPGEVLAQARSRNLPVS